MPEPTPLISKRGRLNRLKEYLSKRIFFIFSGISILFISLTGIIVYSAVINGDSYFGSNMVDAEDSMTQETEVTRGEDLSLPRDLFKTSKDEPKIEAIEEIVIEEEGATSSPAENLRTITMQNPFTGFGVEGDAARNLRLRPWVVMVDNHPRYRSDISLQEADIVYEAVVEHGVTALMPVFSQYRPENFGPVGDLRYYFAALAAEYYPFLIYNKGMSRELGDPENAVAAEVDTDIFIEDYILLPVERLNGAGEVFEVESDFNNTGEDFVSFTNSALFPYLGRTYGTYLWIESDIFRKWGFKDDSPVSEGKVEEVTYNFWDKVDYEVNWRYNPGKNEYLRYQGGHIYFDSETGNQISVKNVILKFVEEESAEDLNSNLKYNIIGSGDAYIYLDGGKIEGRWEKDSVASRTMFMSGGEEVDLNRGNTWIAVLPITSKDQVKEK